MSFTIEDWGSDDIIDSSEITQRLEELTDEQADLASDITDADDNEDAAALAEAEARLAAWEKENLEELNALREICKQGEDYGDWSHGDALILDSYFTKYIEELIDDCYEMPKGFDSGAWPWRHMKIDYEAAADEAKSDYVEIECNGHTYYFRA